MYSRQKHWDGIYSSKQPDEVSWTQQIPKTSLDFIHHANLPVTAPIIDIGGGDSRLIDYLLDEGYQDLTVLDISPKAIERVKERLGDRARAVKWIVSDITEFEPNQKYDFWHDRATFHFLQSSRDIELYLSIARKAVKANGLLTIGTFSTQGPEACSGLAVKQYSEESLTSVLKDSFEKITCIQEDHITPFETRQNFLFCSFKRQIDPS